MSDDTIPIFLSAGDPSGDIAGFHLIKRLQSRRDKFKFIGLGGKRMRLVGQEQIVDGTELAVIGFWEVAKRFLFFKKLLSNSIRLIREKMPKVVILIDYPGFNLRLAEKIRPLGIPIVYYVSPQIWAWGAKRIGSIKRNIDLMLLILPFEKKIYDKAGVNNKFIGHYLLDDMDEKFVKSPYNIDSDLIVLMPGSRPQEVHRMLPTLLDTVKLLSNGKKWRFAVAGVEGEIDYNYYAEKSGASVEIITGRTRELIHDSRLVITASGTATMETAIIGRPMIVIYKTGLLTYLIARRMVKLDMIALVNVTAGEKVVPELIQNDASPGKIAGEVARYLDNNDLSLSVVNKLNRITDRLGSPGVSDRAADAIREYVHC